MGAPVQPFTAEPLQRSFSGYGAEETNKHFFDPCTSSPEYNRQILVIYYIHNTLIAIAQSN